MTAATDSSAGGRGKRLPAEVYIAAPVRNGEVRWDLLERVVRPQEDR